MTESTLTESDIVIDLQKTVFKYGDQYIDGSKLAAIIFPNAIIHSFIERLAPDDTTSGQSAENSLH